MNILRAKWESTLADAYKLCDQGVSTSAYIYALNEAWRFRELMKEAEEKEKRAKSEEISWGKWKELMHKAREACIYQGNFEAVRDILDAASVMKNKVRVKEEAARVAAKEAVKRAAAIAKEEATKTTFEETGVKIGKLVAEKNKAYGDSFSKSDEILKILYPNGIALGDYKNLLSIVRIVDKLFRIATDEGFESEEPWRDIAGYGILKVREAENKNP